MAPRPNHETRLPWDLYLAVIRIEVDRVLEVTDDLDADVPGCPGWTARDLLEHLGLVFRHKVESMRTASEPPWPIEGLDTSDVRRLLAEETATLLAELQQRGPREVRHSWWPGDRSNGFWFRRMALEATVHRVDAEQAAGVTVTPIEPEVALDGIGEFLTVFLGGPWWDDEEELTAFPVDARVRIVADGRAWTLTLSPQAVEVDEDDDAPVDLVVEGSPHAVYLWLWGRDSDGLVLDGRADLRKELEGRFAEASA